MSQIPEGSHKPLNDISESVLGWEVPVESVPLPSGGTLYSPSNFFYNKKVVQIKAMTAKEEDILSSSAFIKDGSTIDRLIASCVMCPLKDVNELLLGDRHALLVSIRVTGYGPNYDVNITCPHCNHTSELNFDLGTLGIIPLNVDPIEEGANIFSFDLPVSKKRVLFKIFNGKDEDLLAKEIKQAKKIMGQNSVGAVTYRLFRRIISIDGVDDRDQIKKFVDIMPAYDAKSLRKYASDIEPKLDSTINFTCPNCKTDSQVRMPIGKNFFWPA